MRPLMLPPQQCQQLISGPAAACGRLLRSCPSRCLCCLQACRCLCLLQQATHLGCQVAGSCPCSLRLDMQNCDNCRAVALLRASSRRRWKLLQLLQQAIKLAASTGCSCAGGCVRLCLLARQQAARSSCLNGHTQLLQQ